MEMYMEDKIMSYDISSNVDAFFDHIEARITELGVPRDKISIGVNYDNSTSNWVEAYLSLRYEREETTLERQQREEKARRVNEWDRQTYERLKAKFGDE